MFQNTYQNGSFFDLFNPKAPPQKTKDLYQIQHVHNNIKVQDKQTKSPIFIFAHPHSKISFPKAQEKDLGLIQQFLTIQIFIIPGLPWSIQLGISDSNKIKKRIIFASDIKKTEKKAFYIKYHSEEISQGSWINLTINLYSFMNAFSQTKYRALDSIHIRGFFKLRRIYTTKNSVSYLEQNNIDQSDNYIPKNFKFPNQVYYENCFVQYIPIEKQNQKQMENTKIKAAKRQQQLILPKIKSKSVERHKCKYRYLNQNNHLKQNVNLIKQTMGQLNAKVKNDKKILQKIHPICKSELLEKEKPKKINFSLRKLKSNKQNLINCKIANPSKIVHEQIQTQCNENEESKVKLSKFMEQHLKDIKTERTSETAKTKFRDQKQSGILNNSSNISSNHIQKSYKLSSVGDNSGVENINCQHLNYQQIQEDIQQQSSIIFNQNQQGQFKVQKPQKHRRLSKSQAQLQFQVSKMKALDPRNLKQNSYDGFGQKIINNCIKQIERPYSPPLGDFDAIQSPQNSLILPQHKQLELIFDPVLEHYYDCKTKTYYELKNK